jgi:hypothetical protein
MPSVFDCQYPPELRTKEETFIADRRAAANLSKAQRSQPVVGLAFSGGGIRSATFCLGVLRALADGTNGDPNRISLRGVDLLSTVSGGGYVGAFLGGLYSRDGANAEAVEQQLTSASSPSVYWLRENGRYLAPNGSGDAWLAASTVLRNWVSVAIVMSASVLAALMVAQFARVVARDVLPSFVLEKIGAAFGHPVYSIYWSPFFLAPLLVLVFVATPFGWAYWLGRWQAAKVDQGWVWAMTIVVTVSAAIGAVVASVNADASFAQRVSLFVLGILGALTLLVAVVLTVKADGETNYVSGQRTFRNLASRALTGSVIAIAALLGVALVDSLGQTVYVFAQAPYVRNAMLASVVAAIGVLLTAGQKISTFLDKGKQKHPMTLPVAVVAGIAGVFVSFALLGGLSAVSHNIARGSQIERCDRKPHVSVSLNGEYVVVGQALRCDVPLLPALRETQTAAAAAALVVLTLLLGRSLPFVNLSSLTQFYSARLSRTYIGASNKNRRGGATMTAEMPGDDFDMQDYRPDRRGGPVHLINVTLNETIGGRSQVTDRDRHGLAMAVGPGGLSIGVTHHAGWKDARMAAIEPIKATAPSDPDHGYHIWSNSPQPIEPKRLSLSQWTAISGAAVATGMGAQTKLGLSLLLGIGNVRLGYWWDSKVEPEHQGGAAPKPSVRLQRAIAKTFPVQSALMQELLAQFQGPHRRLWYLSDGGHFENTACYEFLRRRVPLIVVCDDGADPDYAFGDLANLVRKARLDFNATVRFLSSDDPIFGHFADLKRKPPMSGASEHAPKIDLDMPLSRRHLLLGRIDYPGGEQIGHPPNEGSAHSLVVVLKPTLTGDEPLDVLQYAASHPAFPQEPTSDQFFDEAQWESYRRLGEHIGRIVTTLDLPSLWKKVADDAYLV